MAKKTSDEILDSIPTGTSSDDLTEEQRDAVMGAEQNEFGDDLTDEERALLGEDEAEEQAEASEGSEQDEEDEEEGSEAGAEKDTPEVDADEEAEGSEEDEDSDEEESDEGSERDTPTDQAGRDKEIEEKLKQLDDPVARNKMTPRERGVLHQLRAERNKRQALEQEFRTTQFQLKKLKDQAEAGDSDEEEDEEGFATNKNVQAKLDKRSAQLEADQRNTLARVWELEAATVYPDFHQTMAQAEAIMDSHPEYATTVRDAHARGENVALIIYDLVKSDPAYKPPVSEGTPAKTSKTKTPSKEAISKAKKLQTNAKKTKTTAQAGAGGGGAGDPELTLDYARSLTDADFAALPKEKQDKILELYG